MLKGNIYVLLYNFGRQLFKSCRMRPVATTNMLYYLIPLLTAHKYIFFFFVSVEQPFWSRKSIIFVKEK